MTGQQPRPSTVAVPVGYEVGSWRVERLLGSGGFGSVYTARRTTAVEPRRAALKFLPTGTRTPRQLRHLRDLAEREIEVLRRVRAPRLIRMHEVLTVDDPDLPDLDGATVLVLDHAETSLDQVLTRTPRPPSAPALLTQICEGLVQLHGAGWVHGDLKPGNVLVMADGTIRLADFNMAAQLEGTHAYAPGFATPDFTPPELLWSDITERGRLVRPTGDIWAFGVLAHLVLTGSMPLPGPTAAARRTALTHYVRGEQELRLAPELPSGWRQIIGDCLAPSHDGRASHDARFLLRRIERLQLPAQATESRRRDRLLLSAVLVTAVCAVAAGTAFLLGPDDTKSPTAEGSDIPSAPAGTPSAPASLVAYDRCISGSVCFYTEPDGGGRMCAWEGDEVDWLAGKNVCSWATTTAPRSVFNNGKGTALGETLVNVTYFAEKHLQKQLGCLPPGTRRNLDAGVFPRSHVWTDSCA
ncbi:serine/threonine protein kinase [Embleya scabrispora]|uniref:Serine/threonine protein kinase n=1 Tax=Embleya scabrispora TaxID=159449 RepID=A0A1T3NP26_9ACTN|nr:serine/threonine-protein kinase [Embleya scabrispora]OPC78411.1 serine/threonine protein kinase [Embleya scabrispora]